MNLIFLAVMLVVFIALWWALERYAPFLPPFVKGVMLGCFVMTVILVVLGDE